ncbi:hypothetical protein BD410DRAFT_901222 [Rickenella mellea]|uniref:DUF7702 domain-containing protein n=1 Tax=Rickenella mellea TaxID=50990 RepID=A0A4Y7PSP6_9AGAM|nr:hypothetical protein BD410DRAFT_901222 [Rickenella mellea]
MGLDARGIIAIIQIVLFVPIFCFTLFITLRHGFKRDAGWVFLLIFSVIRIVGGVMLVVAESLKHPSTGVYITAYVLASVGLSPLLFATLGFLRAVDQFGLSGLPIATRHWRVLRLLLVVALALAIVGGTDASSSSLSTQHTGTTLRKVASLIFLGSFIIIVIIHFLYWSRKDKILLHRRTLLVGISAALPFLAVRILYSILSSFSPNSLGAQTLGVAPGHTSLSKFNTVTGSWVIYLIMSLLMEIIAVLIYCTTGTLIPLQKEEQDYESGPNKNAYQMNGQNGGQVDQGYGRR